ncbi:MAG: beta-galactosidase [Ilumatobacteraceae bacterium]|nr:beta-galactosidase [Ilumatobacteraceae bacterium]
MRVPTVAHASIDAARAAEPSTDRIVLDGRWSLRLFGSPDVAVLDGRTELSGAVSWCGDVDVPGNWTMQGTGDLPHYTNVVMPFPGPPPQLPHRNPTGVYSRSFAAPRDWLAGRRIVIHIGGAESVHAVFVNGAFAGYGTDSKLASEYDITDHVVAGVNALAVAVVRYSAQSYVEDQDQWWMAGLHREVFVDARRPVRVGNLRCDADLEVATGTGRLRVTTTVDFGGVPARGWSVRSSLETLTGRRLGPAVTTRVPSTFVRAYAFTGHHAVAEHTVARVVPWSAEQPRRYRAFVELIDPTGAVAEVHAQLVGFRHVEVKGRQLLVNGGAVWIFGVNRHDHDPARGSVVTVDDMRRDLVLMKQHNINACAPRTTRTTQRCWTSATSSGCTWSTRRTSRATPTTRRCATTIATSRPGSRAAAGWWSATATTRA